MAAVAAAAADRSGTRAATSRSTATTSFDSSGPDLRVRGTAQQLFEKYLQLGRDATSGGDRVMAESYFQHAEHYFRILNAMNQAAAQQQGGQPQQQNGQQRRQTNEPQGDAARQRRAGWRAAPRLRRPARRRFARHPDHRRAARELAG